MLDLYQDIAIISDIKNLRETLKKGYKKVYLKKKVSNQKRIYQLTWISPYQETFESSYYLVKENNLRIFGNIKKVYYNPRYCNDRKNLKELLKNFSCKDYGVIGSGLGVYPLYIYTKESSITQYQINEEAIRYSKINKVINKVITNVRYTNKGYRNQPHEALISVMPTIPVDFYKKITFSKLLITYCLGTEDEIKNVVDLINSEHNTELESKTVVRPYSKKVSIYRLNFIKKNIT